MPKCSNCGQRTKGEFCQWCGYPIMSGGSVGKAITKKKAQEARGKAKMEAQEAKERAKREAIETKERVKKEAKEAKERAKREAEVKAKMEAEPAAKEEAKKEVQETVSGELYEGIVTLTIAPPIDSGQVRKLEEYLSQVQDLRLALVCGSVDEGTEIVISVDKPTPLIDVLKEMPPAEQVVKKGKKIQITLRTE